MEALSIHLALHGLLVLLVSVLGGVVLWRVLLKREYGPQWHLLHAGGTVRGVLLIALAAVIPVLPFSLLLVSTTVWLMIVSIWASIAAMLIAAITGDRGLNHKGSIWNRLIFGCYVVHGVTLFPAMLILIYGLALAL